MIMGIAITLMSCKSERSNSIEFLNNINGKPNDYPFSKAVRTGNLLFLSGQIGKDPKTGKLVSGGIKAEADQVLENIKSVLKANGTGMGNVVKCTVILDDINDFADMNTVYKTFFFDNYPARTTFAGDLVGDAKIEIEAIAVID